MQPNLFSDVRVSRNTDPDSSKYAETAINDSGLRAKQQLEVLNLVRANPGRTSLELSRCIMYENLDRYQIARRLSDLNESGYVVQGAIRQCRVGRRKAVTWWIKGRRPCIST